MQAMMGEKGFARICQNRFKISTLHPSCFCCIQTHWIKALPLHSHYVSNAIQVVKWCSSSHGEVIPADWNCNQVRPQLDNQIRWRAPSTSPTLVLCIQPFASRKVVVEELPHQRTITIMSQIWNCLLLLGNCNQVRPQLDNQMRRRAPSTSAALVLCIHCFSSCKVVVKELPHHRTTTIMSEIRSCS